MTILATEDGQGLDSFALDLAVRLLNCVTDQARLTRGGRVCRSALYSGGDPAAMDWCCKGRNACGDACHGQASVRVASIYPTTPKFPVVDGGPKIGCDHQMYAVVLEAALYRCASVINEHGEAPPVTHQYEEVAIQLDDAAAMRRAAKCCLSPVLEADLLPYARSGIYVEGSYVPIGPAGDCVGGRQQFTFQIYDADCECDPQPPEPDCL